MFVAAANTVKEFSAFFYALEAKNIKQKKKTSARNMSCSSCVMDYVACKNLLYLGFLSIAITIQFS